MDSTIAPLTSIGLDIGEEVFHLVGFGSDGNIAFRRKIKRLALVETFRKLPACIVGMEACLSAHFVSRALRQIRLAAHDPGELPKDAVAVEVAASRKVINRFKEFGELDRPEVRQYVTMRSSAGWPSPCRPTERFRHSTSSPCRSSAAASASRVA